MNTLAQILLQCQVLLNVLFNYYNAESTIYCIVTLHILTLLTETVEIGRTSFD